MRYENAGRMNFFSEMSEHQITAREFFSAVLLDSLDRNFGLKKGVISYFDTEGKFLSWTSWEGILIDYEEHPYRGFAPKDVVRQRIYKEAVRDHLTYFNTSPRLYKATDIIDKKTYASSEHVRFLEEQFHARYSVTMAFGINAYIQVTFLKEAAQGDFTDQEMEELKEIYLYLANSYKNFKKYEQAKIVAYIQGEIIASGEKAYLVTDDFMHIMGYNNTAQEYLKEILGPSVTDQMSSTTPCSWLPFLLGGGMEKAKEDVVQTRVIKNYIFKVYTYDRSYSNGIIDRYHWITISREQESTQAEHAGADMPLTQTEKKVARLMYNGLTYKAIADELVVSYHTVKKHVQNIYAKCGVNSRFELYRWLEEKEQK